MKKTHIIAEIAWGHDGKVQQAIDLLNAAKRVGADSISIHITELEDYMVKHYGSGEGKVSAGRESLNVYKYLDEINLSKEDWKNFKVFADKINMPICVMANDLPSLRFSSEFINPDFYVVSAACFVEEEFLKSVAILNKKTLFRIGGANLGEIEKAINIFKQNGNEKIVLLHGFQNYPTELEETNLAQLKSLHEIFGLEVGLADHIDGGDSIAEVIPILALAYGATYIEKHLTLDRDKKSEDFESALDPVHFNSLVKNIRAAEIAIGKTSIGLMTDSVMKYRNISRKRIVAQNDIAIGEEINKDNIHYKRSDVGIQPDKTELLLGRKAKVHIQKDDSITIDKLG